MEFYFRATVVFRFVLRTSRKKPVSELVAMEKCCGSHGGHVGQVLYYPWWPWTSPVLAMVIMADRCHVSHFGHIGLVLF